MDVGVISVYGESSCADISRESHSSGRRANAHIYIAKTRQVIYQGVSYLALAPAGR